MTATPSTDSRIADSSRSWEAACDVDISNWDKANEFILSTWMTSSIGHGNETKNWKLQWKRTGGSFADVTATSEIAWGTNTALTNDTNIISGTSATCFTFGNGEESEGDNVQALRIDSGNNGEIQWALGFGAGALDSQEYEFQIVNTDDTTQATCSCSITTAAPPSTYKIEGFTKTVTGAMLASADCYLVKNGFDNTYSFQLYTISSDPSGAYSFTGIADNDTGYQVISWKDGGTNVFDVTDHVLTGVVE